MNARFFLLLGATVATAEAASWSLRERGYVAAIPESFSKHASGIVQAPTDADVQDAILFGKSAKEKEEPLTYAYLIKESTSVWATDAIYVEVATPLYLIAQHARDQAREFRKIDDAYVAYVRNLGAVRISLNNQFISAKMRAVAFSYDVILLRDGERVETLQSISAWKGGSPFAKPLISREPMLAAVQRAALQSLRTSVAQMGDEAKAATARQLTATGYTDGQICEVFGWSAEDLSRVRGDKTESGAIAKISLASSEAVFAVDELRKPGKYELVFRRPEVGVLGSVNSKEVRFAVDFSRFR